MRWHSCERGRGRGREGSERRGGEREGVEEGSRGREEGERERDHLLTLT